MLKTFSYYSLSIAYKILSLVGTKQSYAIENLHIKIASPFVPQDRNDEKQLFVVDSSLYLETTLIPGASAKAQWMVPVRGSFCKQPFHPQIHFWLKGDGIWPQFQD